MIEIDEDGWGVKTFRVTCEICERTTTTYQRTREEAKDALHSRGWVKSVSEWRCGEPTFWAECPGEQKYA